jgi:hypothetical protein
MGRKKRPPDDDKKQSEQFKKAAEQLEGNKEAFEMAVKAVLKTKKSKAQGQA